MRVSERGSSYVFELADRSDAVIGRADNAEIRIRDPRVSRRHAVVAIADDRVTLRDLGSHNGTFVNGHRLFDECTLHPGDAIEIAGAMFLTMHQVNTPDPCGSFAELRDRLADELERARDGQHPVAVVTGTLARAEDRDVARSALTALHIGLVAWPDPTHFVIVASETDHAGADAITRHLLHALAGIELQLGAAVGPIDGGDVDALIARAIAAARVPACPLLGAERPRAFQIGERDVVVADPAMVRLYALIERVATADLPVLLVGETGSGKELAARMVHEQSSRRSKALISINCAAIPQSLAESELFGSERGAFSGAHTKLGLLEAANGGTIFFDEIGELSLAIQAKLLRVLETKRVVRVGDVHERELDVRFVAATNRDLSADVAAGKFRQDLLFRINAATFSLPPLRERKREIALLARHFLTQACRSAHRETIAIADDAMSALETYRWPGNIRELKNVMEFFAATLPSERLSAAHVTNRIAPASRPARVPSRSVAEFAPLADEIRALEIQRITQALQAAAGNQTRAAEMIGMPLRTFFSKVRQYNLKWSASTAEPT